MTATGTAVDDVLATHGLADVGAWLAEYVPQQRWFGGRERELDRTDVYDVAVLREDSRGITVLFVLLEAVYREGASELYHVPLAVRERHQGVLQNAGAETVMAEIERGGKTFAVYEALVDPEAAYLLWEAIAQDEGFTTVRGRISCLGDEIDLDAGGPDAVRPLGREQSNTSLIRGGRDMLKCMRHVEFAPSPELEMQGALKLAGFSHIAAPIGVMQYHVEGRDPGLLAVVQPYLRNGTEGWALALTSLRDLYADAEEAEHRDRRMRRRSVKEQGASFTSESSRLGEVTAELHRALADSRHTGDMAADVVDAALLGRWADEMRTEIEALLARDNQLLDPLRERRDGLLGRTEAIRAVTSAGLATRIHGDYHLGQVLRTDGGWTVLDFEGEPARPATERRFRSSPLRDVAGMLRSFDYAAAAVLLERTNPRDSQWDELMAQGDVWADINRTAFWKAYLDSVGDSPLIPHGDDALVVRRAFEVQKAVYEVGYELGHRPDWVRIPLSFLLREAQ